MDVFSFRAHEVFSILLGIILFRYLVVSTAFHLLCAHLRKPRWRHRRLQKSDPGRRQIAREIGWSILSCIVFAAAGTLGWLAWESGYTKVYLRVADYGVGYLIFSVPLLLFVHDTYFYFVHRLMHHKLLFRRIHRVHHESINPTAFASFTFHPWEALLEALILPLIVLVIPTHPAALLAFLTAMTIFGVVNHTGHELYPKAFGTSRWLRAWLTVTHHQMHHHHFRANYGLYFTLWDKWLGTEHPEYERTFASAAEGSTPGEAPVYTV